MEISYLGKSPHGLTFQELCLAVDQQILAGKDPSGIAFGKERQLFRISRTGKIDVKESQE